MIVTVTPNPALDLTYTVDRLVPHGTHRVAAVAERPGGKGVNVAAVLHALGEPVLATGLLGGGTGARVAALLAADGVPESFMPIRAETRRTVAVADHDDATGFWEPGPRVTGAEWAAFVGRFGELLAGADAVALCGSLPPGAPVDGYAALIRLAAARGVPTVLDTSGEALRHALAAGPDLVKPNAAELAALLSPHAGDPDRAAPGDSPHHTRAGDSPHHTRAGDSPHHTRAGNGSHHTGEGDGPGGAAYPADADAARLLGFGARPAVVSRGAGGLLGLTAAGTWRAVPPERLAGNPTGAGDACVAALARGLRDAADWPALLTDAVALSGAAVAAPVAGAFDPAVYRRLRDAVTVTAA